MSDPTNNQALNGLNPLSYLGVNPRTPPNFVQRSFPPTQYDSKNVYIGTLWLDNGTHTPPTINDLYVLVSLAAGIATWLPFSSGDLQFLTGNTGGAVPPTANNINVVGDGTTVTVAGNPGTSTLTISLVGGGVAAQSFPTDSGTATPNGSGVLNINAGNSTKHCGSSVLFSGSGNTVQLSVTDSNTSTFIGSTAGNLTATGQFNSGFGSNTLIALTSGSSNHAWGTGSGSHITTGSNNVLGGASSGSSLTTGDNNLLLADSSANLLVTGSNNVILGRSGGAAYTTSESNNVIVGRNVGVVGESNVIRIGSDGVTTTNQTKCFINGIYGVAPSGSPLTVVINSNGQLGTTGASGGNIQTVATQVFTSSGTYTPTSGMLYCVVEVVGGGGGGGGADVTGAGQVSNASGGGGGGYARKTFTAATIGVSQAVTINSGGGGGSAGNNPGAAGGSVTFGALLSATGGAGGNGAAANAGGFNSGTAGGAGSSGDFNTTGTPGGPGMAVVGIGSFGGGGSSFFGGGSPGVTSAGSTAGTNGTSYGGGGSGAATIVGAAAAGGNGVTGIVIVTEYIS